MGGSFQKDLSVYDFGGAEDVVESDSDKLVRKYTPTNRRTEKSDLMKYNHLHFVAQGQNVQQVETNNVVCVDFDASIDDGKCNNCVSYAIGSSEKDFSVEEETSRVGDILVSTSMTNDDIGHISQDNFETGNLIPGCLRVDSPAMEGLNHRAPSVGGKQLSFTLLELPSNRRHLDVMSDDDESLETRSLSNSASDCAENEGAIEHPTLDHCSSGYVEMEMEIDTKIAVFPDYVIYGQRSFTQCQLTFYSHCIKLEDSNACGCNEPVSYEWAVEEVIHIGCQWKESSSVGTVKLAFAVNDPQWFEKQQKITSLDARYKAIWNVRLDDERASKVDEFMGQTGIFVLKNYFTDFDEPSEEVVYPKGDPDAVSISKRDVRLLEPETFINDTIVDFYIKYLKNKIRPEEKHRFHFFNSFFFRKLADLDKDPGSASEGRAAFQRVRKWTRKVNIFEKDYIFVPVNFNLHWSLIVICHPGEVALFEDHEIDKALKVPCILHMDSIKGNHQGLKNLVQSYLWEEWKERHEESSKDFQLKFSNLRFVPLELPQQENLFDCGLFLLHYVELFLEEAPVDFSPFKIRKFSNFLNTNWFPPTEASHKRFTLRKLIYKLFNDYSEGTPADGINLHHSKFPENDTEIEPGVELLSEQCSPTKKTCLSNSLCPDVNKEIEMELLAISSPGGVHYDKETGVVLQEFFEQGIAESCPDERCEPFDKIALSQTSNSTLSPIQEDAETGEQFISSPLDTDCYRLPDGITAEACTTSYSSKDVGVLKRPSLQEISIQPKEHEYEHSLSECSSFESSKSAKVGLDEPPLPLQSRDFTSSKEHKETENLGSVSPEICKGTVSASSERLDTSIVDDSMDADSEDVNAMGESKEGGESLFSCQETLPASSCQDVESIENDESLGDDSDEVQLFSDVLETSLKQRPKKRRKLIPPEGLRRRSRRQKAERECHF
ncbi:putative ubiquitin-like-specific protease 2B isoform X2 [Tasmannia lanceolata]|uniref:putative ubiquitin-like-specific protease 2B isoform X2 n=1 Tax=Tasmannia lanceolata TaxID=3420 RepID=UPI00406443E6